MKRPIIIAILTCLLAACAPLTTQAASTPTVEPSATPSPPPTTTPSPTTTPFPSFTVLCPSFDVILTGSETVMLTSGTCTTAKAENKIVYLIEFTVNNSNDVYGVAYGAGGDLIFAKGQIKLTGGIGDEWWFTLESVGEVKISLAILPVIEGVSQGQLPPDFTVKDFSGVSHKLSDFAGKTVVVNFWFTTCKPCQKETPDLIQASLDYPNVVFLMINPFEPKSAVFRFFTQFEHFGPNMMILSDDETVRNLYAVFGFPTTLIVGPDGIIRYRKSSAITREEIDFYLR